MGRQLVTLVAGRDFRKPQVPNDSRGSVELVRHMATSPPIKTRFTTGTDAAFGVEPLFCRARYDFVPARRQ
jgi:hypothetical protein